MTCLLTLLHQAKRSSIGKIPTVKNLRAISTSMTKEQSDEVEKCRCPICGHFPQVVIDTYKIDTWVCLSRNPVSHGGDDWYQDCCSCSPEYKERFYENFLAECYALRDEISDRLKSEDK